MKKITQEELLQEGFWNAFKKIGGAIKGTAAAANRALDYVAPEIKGPLKRGKEAIRDIVTAGREGAHRGIFKKGSSFAYKLKEDGYAMNKKKKPKRVGNKYIVTGWRSRGLDKNGEPIPDKKKEMTFIFDRDGNYKIVGTSASRVSINTLKDLDDPTRNNQAAQQTSSQTPINRPVVSNQQAQSSSSSTQTNG